MKEHKRLIGLVVTMLLVSGIYLFSDKSAAKLDAAEKSATFYVA